MVLAIAAAASLMTLLGGAVAMKATTRRHLVLALAGGLMLGVVVLDLLPEAFDHAPARLLGIVPVAGLAFLLGLGGVHLAKSRAGRSPRIGLTAGGGMVLHSLMDGFAIGTAYRMDAGVGALVAVAVIAHDFADGFNAFTVTSLYGNARRRAVAVLTADALAPLAGALLARYVDLSPGLLGLYLGAFAGVLLYVAVTDVLPEAVRGARDRARRPAPAWGLTAAGFVFVWLAVSIAG